MPEPPPVGPPSPRPYFPGGQRFAFFVVLLAVLYGAWVAVRPVAMVLLIAAAAATLTFRVFERITALLRGRRRLSASLCLILVVVLVLGPIALLGSLAVRRVAVEVAEVAPRLGGLPDELRRWVAGTGRLEKLVGQMLDSLGAMVRDVVPSVVRSAGQWAGEIGATLARLVVGGFLFLLALYYFYLDGPRWLDRIVRVLPIEPADTRDFLLHFREVSLGVFVGGLGTAVIQGVVAGLGFWALGVEAPLVWGVLSGAASFVPLVGTALVWGPIAISLFAGGSWIRGLILVGYGLGVISVVDNLARPLLTRLGLPMHPLLVFVAVFGGLAAWGVNGLFFGPLMLATALAALRIYERQADEAAEAE